MGEIDEMSELWTDVWLFGCWMDGGGGREGRSVISGGGGDRQYWQQFLVSYGMINAVASKFSTVSWES